MKKAQNITKKLGNVIRRVLLTVPTDVVYGLMILWEVHNVLVPIQITNMTHHQKNATNLVHSLVQMAVVFGHIISWDRLNVVAMMKIINMTHRRKNVKLPARSPARMIDVFGRITFWDDPSALVMTMEPIITRILSCAKLHQNARSLALMKDAYGHTIL